MMMFPAIRTLCAPNELLLMVRGNGTKLHQLVTLGKSLDTNVYIQVSLRIPISDRYGVDIYNKNVITKAHVRLVSEFQP